MIRATRTSLAFSLVCSLSFACLAGPLSPPLGPVASTSKPLAEIEPRTAVNATNTPGDTTAVHVISQPGSYYLTSNITGISARAGIRITASNVDLDLNGFTLTGVTGATQGISLATGSSRVQIRNGKITNFPSHGITSINCPSFSVSDVVCEFNGANGFDLGDGATAERCSARNNTAIGIRLGAGSLAKDCTTITNATGIELNTLSRAINCTVYTNTTRGILANGNDTTIESNAILSSAANAVGILVNGSRTVVRNNSVNGTSVSGQIGLSVAASSSNNVIADNLIRNHDTDGNHVISASSFGNQISLIITQTPETLNFPCSARLAGTILSSSSPGGIIIASDGVTVDLAGQELVGSGISGTGITSTGARRNVSVRNGAVRGFSSGGINLASCIAPQVINISASANTGTGITTNGGSIINCTANANTANGISAGDNALVSNCVASSNTSDNLVVGQSCNVQDCIANASTTGFGINASFLFNTISRCTTNANALSGIRAQQRTRIHDCTSQNNTQNGIHITFGGSVERSSITNNLNHGILMDAGGGVIIRDNTVSENGNNTTQASGLRVINAGLCRIEGNAFTANYRNIEVVSAANLIIKNTSTAPGAGNHLSIGASNSYGPFVNVSGVGDISATPNANHPQANLLY
ncbi:MAG: right-handed parallel beta-helix repeat-containing protein [Phycisphaerales bacterium]|nr:right-handed parallel beta-helix repeat-containing protein [Phycisphaerales bacterium]